MRKIAANYIWLPGFELIRNGYVVLENGRVTDVVDTGGVIHEIPCLEFYGGMIVANDVREDITWETGDRILEKLSVLYQSAQGKSNGLALIQGADFNNLHWTEQTRVVPLK